jgi:DeoR/GlpR family transcriptional regulator of sugar metabolism
LTFKEDRLHRILAAFHENGPMTVTDLSRRFGVSEVTVRRDLKELAGRGLLRRSHGGAVLAAPASPEPPVIQRMLRDRDWKEHIGRAAAALVADGESVFIGSGSTTAYVAHSLAGRRDLTVVTNAINIATELAKAPGITVVVTGGMMRPSELSLVGHIAEQTLREVRVDKVVIGIPAISLEAGLTNDYLPEVVTDRTIIAMAAQLILVADHSKFGRVASAYVAPVERVTTIVTDPQTDAHALARLRQLGIRVIVADEQPRPGEAAGG